MDVVYSDDYWVLVDVKLYMKQNKAIDEFVELYTYIQLTICRETQTNKSIGSDSFDQKKVP